MWTATHHHLVQRTQEPPPPLPLSRRMQIETSRLRQALNRLRLQGSIREGPATFSSRSHIIRHILMPRVCQASEAQS